MDMQKLICLVMAWVVLLPLGAIADEAPVPTNPYGPIVEIQEVAQVRFRAPRSSRPRFRGPRTTRPRFRRPRSTRATSRSPRFSVIRFQRPRTTLARTRNPRFNGPNFRRPTVRSGSGSASAAPKPRAATPSGPVSTNSRKALGRFTKGVQGLSED